MHDDAAPVAPRRPEKETHVPKGKKRTDPVFAASSRRRRGCRSAPSASFCTAPTVAAPLSLPPAPAIDISADPITRFPCPPRLQRRSPSFFPRVSNDSLGGGNEILILRDDDATSTSECRKASTEDDSSVGRNIRERRGRGTPIPARADGDYHQRRRRRPQPPRTQHFGWSPVCPSFRLASCFPRSAFYWLPSKRGSTAPSRVQAQKAFTLPRTTSFEGSKMATPLGSLAPSYSATRFSTYSASPALLTRLMHFGLRRQKDISNGAPGLSPA